MHHTIPETKRETIIKREMILTIFFFFLEANRPGRLNSKLVENTLFVLTLLDKRIMICLADSVSGH